MQITTKALPQHLKQSLHALYWVHGDEPYQIHQASERIIAKAKSEGFSKFYFDTRISWDWSDLLDHQRDRDLFSPKPFLHLSWENPALNASIEEILTQFLENTVTPPECCLLITSKKLSPTIQKSNFYKLIEAKAIIVPIWPIKTSEFPNWVQQEALERQLTISKDAIPLLQATHEGNLLSAIQALDRVSLFSKTVTADLLKEDAANGAQYNVFDTLEQLLMGNKKALISLSALKNQGQELLPLLGAYMKILEDLIKVQQSLSQGLSFTQACQKNGIWSSKIPFFEKTLRPISPKNYKTLQEKYYRGVKIDGLIKNFKNELAWQSFLLPTTFKI